MKLLIFRIALMLILALIALSAICFGWVKLSTASRITGVDTAGHANTGIILGAGLSPDGTPSTILRRRLDMGKKLLDARKVDTLLLSGDGAISNHDEPQAMRDYLIEHGVDSRRLILDPDGTNTHNSCLSAATTLQVKSAIIVTSDFHIPRSLFLCSGYDIAVQGVEVPTDFNVWYAVREYFADSKAVLDYLLMKFHLRDALDF